MSSNVDFKNDLVEFKEETKKFYNKEVTVPEYKSFSGGYGSYAQRGAQKSMLRLRLTGGEVAMDKIQFIADSVAKYDIDLVHLTTCQSIQFHNLSKDTVCSLIDEAYDAGIVTRGGGGDYPRNVMCSPLSGIAMEENFDVLPYAKKAADYLLTLVKTVKLPRKLKVCFCNDFKDETHATFRDLGFVANKDNTFDIYIAGGLGNNYKMGVCAVKNADPSKLLYYIKSMVDVFTQYGNYTTRAKSRTRYLQDTLGVEELIKIYNEKLQDNLKNEQLDIDIKPEITECTFKDNKYKNNTRVIAQKQNGLYTVVYNPLGGIVRPGFFADLINAVSANENVALRLIPSEGMYIINLDDALVEKVLDITNDGAITEFEKSTSCIGATICQVGIGDSQGLLKACVERVRKENFEDGVLPRIHISGCPSSCSAHQIGAIGFRGGKKKSETGLLNAFSLFDNGCEQLGKEKFGTELGVIFEKDIPDFLVELGKAVSAKNMKYNEYRKQYENEFLEIVKKYI